VSGTDTITATFSPALTAGLVDGMSAILRPVATNTGAVTLNGTAVKDGEGNALTAGALRNGGAYDLVYVSALTAFCMVGYFPAAAVSPVAKLIKTLNASSSSTIDFVNGVSGVVFDDTYDKYLVEFSTVKPATDDVELWLRVGTGGGPTYQTTSYRYAFTLQSDVPATTNRGSNSAGQIILGQSSSSTAAIGNATGENASGRIFFPNPEATDFHTVNFQTTYFGANSVLFAAAGGGCWTQGTAVTALRFMMESGNIVSGRFSLYGMTKA
jgi:hypothetical protein